MSSIGATGGGQVGKAAEILKNAGTGPTPIEKKISDAIVKTVKDGFDTMSKFVTSPEGSAITTGVLLKTVTPFSPVGDAFIFGGAAYAALKYLDNHSNIGTTLAKDALVGTAGALIVPVNPVLGAAMVGASTVDAAVSVAKEVRGTANRAVEAVAQEARETIKDAAKGTVAGAIGEAAKAVENFTKPRVY